MGLKDLFKKDKTVKNSEFKQLLELEAKYEALDSETNKRYNRYREYDRFHHGEQWHNIDKFEGRKYVTNLCAPTVQKYTALLMGDFPKIHCPKKSETSIKWDVPYLGYQAEEGLNTSGEANRSEAKEKIIRDHLYKKNDINEFKEGAMAGSLYGDTIFYHYWDGDKVKIENIAPCYVRAKFVDNNYRKLEHTFLEQIVSLTEIERKFGIKAAPDTTISTIWDTEGLLHTGNYAVLKKYYDDEYFAVIVNGQFAVKPTKHNLPRVPFTIIPNRWDPFRPWGKSDLKDVLSLQEEYNIAVSDEAKITRLYSHPKAVAKNIKPKDVAAIKNAAQGGFGVLPIRQDADLAPFEFKNQIYPIQQRIQNILDRFYMVSGLVPVFWGSVQGSIVTGVAMTAQASPTLQMIRDKMSSWQVGLQSVIEFILQTLEKKGGTEPDTGIPYKEIIDRDYSVELQPENRMPRDDSIYITNEINKMNAGIQSRETTMTKLGVESPEDEMRKIAYEKNHPLYSPDFALKRAEAEAKIGGGAALGRTGRPAQGPGPEVTRPPEIASEPMPAGQPGAAGGSNLRAGAPQGAQRPPGQ